MNLFTEAAADRAMKNGRRDFDKYDVVEAAPGVVDIIKKDGTGKYHMLLDDNNVPFWCTCPQNKHEGICKHEFIVAETLRIDAMAKELEEAEDLYAKL